MDERAKRLAPHIAEYERRLNTERVLYTSLNPDMIALEGLDKIALIDPSHPEKGWRLKSDDELPFDRSIDLEDWQECDIDEVPIHERSEWHMSQTDGVPVPDDMFGAEAQVFDDLCDER